VEWCALLQTSDACMVVLIHTDLVVSTAAAVYLEEIHRTIIPAYLEAEGILSASIVRRDLLAYSEMVLISWWRSRISLDAFLSNTGNLNSVRNVTISKEPLIFEVLASWVERRPEF
jgi:hypothetical protein